MLRLLAVCIALAAARAQDPAAQATPQPEGRISGTVMGAGSGQPLSDTRVSLSLGQGKSISATTDSAGRYSLKSVPPGQYRVGATAPDREGRIGGFGPSATRQVVLRPGEDLSNFDFRLTIHARVTGKVVDQNNEPVPGLRVVAVAREYHSGALRSVMTFSGTTDDLGEYVIERLQPGRAYRILADRGFARLNPYSEAPLDPALRRPAFVPTYFPNSRVLEGGEPVILRDGETREGVDIKVVRGPSFCMEGRITGSFGARTHFSVAPAQPTSGSVGTSSSYYGLPGATLPPDGRIRVCDLPPGDYELVVSESAAGTFADLVNFSTTSFTITDRDIPNVTAVARPMVPLKGEVTWAGQPPDPLPAGELRLLLQAVTRTNRANTKASIPGEFAFEKPIPMDEYQLDITGLPPGVYIKDVVYGDRSVRYTTIRPGTGMADAPLRIALASDGGTIGATVLDKSGSPVSECHVVLLPASAASDAFVSAAMRTGTSDQYGRWSSPPLAPGKYILLATPDVVDRSPETIARIWAARSRGETVELTTGGKPAVTLALKPLQ